jgi:FkbM family methyltransferase
MGYNNFTGLERSGEAWMMRTVLPILVTSSPPVFLDVGASTGDNSQSLLEVFPDAILHAFEPNPRTFAKLHSHLSSTSAKLHQYAIGAEEGSAILYDLMEWQDGYEGWQASMSEDAVRTHHAKDSMQSHPVQVTTLDNVLKLEEISNVDFLKIDTEGFEMDVFRGAVEAMKAHRIGVIQFEFSELNVARREFLCDFQQQLSDYRLFRILKGGLLPFDELPVHEREVFTYQNILAVPVKEAPKLQQFHYRLSRRNP